MRMPERKRSRRKQMTFYLNDEERKLLEEKMTKYGYNSLVGYLRDAAIYECVFVENIQGREELTSSMSEMIVSFKQLKVEVNKLVYSTSVSAEDIEKIKTDTEKISEQLIEIKKELETKLEITFDKEKVVDTYGHKDIEEALTKDHRSEPYSQLKYSFEEKEEKKE